MTRVVCLVLYWAGVLLTLVATPAMADDGGRRTDSSDLTYRAYLAGIEFAAIHAELIRDGREYRMTAHLAVTGLFAKLLPWTTKLRSWGETEAVGGLRIQRLRAENSWRGRLRHVQVRYHAGEAVIETADPPPYDGARKVETTLTRNTVDPLGAALATSRALAAGQSCDRRLAVFDGRRRYDLILRHGGSQRLMPEQSSRFAGEATLCILRVEPVAGFRRDRRPWIDPDKPTRVWFAPPLAGAPPLPVRIDTATPLGRVMIHLTAATANGFGESAAGTGKLP